MYKNYILENIKDFHLPDILECGQCFHFERTDQGMNPDEFEYEIVALNHILHIKEERTGDTVRLTFFDTEKWEYDTIWKDYFDMDRDYSLIKQRIIEADPRLEEIIQEHSGLRILNQDFFETLISFIVSQNKQIPQIKQVVKNLSTELGSRFDVTMISRLSSEFDAFFPTVEELYAASEEDVRATKCGFRAPYIMDAASKVMSGLVTEKMLREMSTDEAREKLMSIYGVGEKVANCVLLFGLGRREEFPVDVWMKRICEYLYYDAPTAKNIIEKDAKERFGEYAGYAQQYLFIYGQKKKIGAK